MRVEERSLDSKAVCKGRKDMTTDANLTGSGKVQRLQRMLHWTGRAFVDSSNDEICRRREFRRIIRHQRKAETLGRNF